MSRVSRRNFLKKTAPFIAAASLAGLASRQLGHASNVEGASASRQANSVVPPSYIIYQDAGNILAVNGRTGFPDFSGPDASVVIRSALGELDAGGLIFLKRGTYTLTGGLTVTERTHLLGESGTCFKVGNNAQTLGNSFNILEVSGSDVTIESIEFDGNTANNPNLAGTTSDVAPANPTIQSGIMVNRGRGVKMLRCYLHDLWNAGIWLAATIGNVENSEIAGCRLESTGLAYSDPSTTNQPQSANAIYAFRKGGLTSRAQIHNNFIQDTYGRGIYLHFDTDSILSGNTLTSSLSYSTETAGIIADDAVRRLTILGNRVWGYCPGIFLVWSGCEDVIVDGNYCAAAPNSEDAGSGILVTNVNSGPPVLGSIIIKGNICKNNAGTGMTIAASDVIVHGNICYNNNQDSVDLDSRRAGILIQGAPVVRVAGIIMSGNRCYDNQANPTQYYGISISQQNDSVANVLIANNDLRGNGRGPIGELSGSSYRVTGNIGYNPGGLAPIDVGSSPFTYRNTDGVDEVVYIEGGSVSRISKNDEAIFASTPATVLLEPDDWVTIVHADPPKMLKDKR